MASEEHAHHFSSWTKERLAEIDATTSIETQFQGALHKQQHEGEAAWAKAKTALDENLSWKSGALPSNSMAALFKGAQDRAMDIAMEISESAFTFAGKISKAQTFQDILTLQTQFAQDRMQAFTTQTQELYKLIGETVQKVQRG
jgi:hypothetical protein